MKNPPDPARTAIAKMLSDIREHTLQSEEATSTIVQNYIQNFPLTAAGLLPKKETLSRMIRWKQQAPDELHRTTHGEEFLALHDNDLDLYIFTTDSNLEIMCAHQHWFCDGTFDNAPEGYQLYTICIVVNRSRTIPLVYAIANNKSRNTYDWILGYLKG